MAGNADTKLQKLCIRFAEHICNLPNFIRRWSARHDGYAFLNCLSPWPLTVIKMRSIKIIRLIWTFYKNFLPAALFITVCCLSLFWKYGFGIFTELFWFKIATLGLIFYFINGYKNKEYYYYQNLGVSKVLLWAATLIFDLALFIFLIFLINQFK